MSVSEVLETFELPVKRAALYSAIDKGQLPSVRLGKRIFIPTQAIFDLFGLGHAATAPQNNEAPRSTTGDPVQDLNAGGHRGALYPVPNSAG
jgi:hypothetical protein